MPAETRALWTGSGVGVSNGPLTTVPPGEVVSVFINTTVAATTATFTVQWSVDGQNWATADPTDVFTAITATGAVCKSFVPKGTMMRLALTTATGTTSFVATAVGCLNDAYGP